MAKWDIGNIVDKKDVAEVACKCNELQDRRIAKIDGQYIIVETKKHEPSLEEQLANLEVKYSMPRVIREGILANPEMYSEFNVNRARDLEDIAEKIRKIKEGK